MDKKEVEKLRMTLALLGYSTLFLVFGLTVFIGEIHWWSYAGGIIGVFIGLSSNIFKENDASQDKNVTEEGA